MQFVYYRSNSPKGLLGQLRISKIVKIDFSPFDCPGCYMSWRLKIILRFYKEDRNINDVVGIGDFENIDILKEGKVFNLGFHNFRFSK